MCKIFLKFIRKILVHIYQNKKYTVNKNQIQENISTPSKEEIKPNKKSQLSQVMAEEK